MIRTPIIYSIKNLANGKLYIGSTVYPRWRRNNHFFLLRHKKHNSLHLQHAYDKYGHQNFAFIILEHVLNPVDLLDRENFWIQNTKSLSPDYGYNLRKEAGSNRGMKRTLESRLRLSRKMLGQKRKPFSKEWRENLSKAGRGLRTGEKNPMFGKPAWNTGLTKVTSPLLQEIARKISIAHKNNGKNKGRRPWNKGIFGYKRKKNVC